LLFSFTLQTFQIPWKKNIDELTLISECAVLNAIVLQNPQWSRCDVISHPRLPLLSYVWLTSFQILPMCFFHWSRVVMKHVRSNLYCVRENVVNALR